MPAIVPLAAVAAVDPSGYAPFGAAKWAAIGVLTLGSAALALWHRPARLDRTSTLLAVAVVVWAVTCTVGGLAGWAGVVGTAERHAGLLLWVLCALAFLVGQQVGDPSSGSAGALVAGVLAGGAVLGGYGLVELFWRAPVATGVGSVRLLGPFGSAAYLGAACALFLPPAVGVWLERRLPIAWRMLGGTVAVAILVVAIGSGTRAAWVGLGVAALVVAMARRHELRRVSRDIAVVVVLAVAAIALAFALAPERSVTAALARQTRATSRIDEWRIAARVVAAHPITGAGPEGYRVVFPTKVDDEYERAYGRVVVPDRAHDMPLDVAAVLGLPGLALYLALLVVVGRRVVRLAARGDLLAAGLAAGLIAYVTQGLFLFPLAELEPVAWLVAGLVVALDLGPERARTASSSSAAESSCLRVRLPRVAAVVAGALTVVVAMAGLAELRADRHARRALTAVASGRTSEALDQARRARGDRPDVVRYRVVAARALALAGRPAAAVAQLDAGAEVSPHDPVLLVERARTLDTPEAWQAVLDRDPRNGAAWASFGTSAARVGRSDDAEAAWMRAEELAPKDVAPILDLARLYLAERRLDLVAQSLERARSAAPGDPRVVDLAAALDAAAG